MDVSCALLGGLGVPGGDIRLVHLGQRIDRHWDKQYGVMNLRRLLYEVEERPDILAIYGQHGAPTKAEVVRDRDDLVIATAKVREYAERLLAHRTPVQDISVTVDDVDAALKAVVRVIRNYYAYLKGSYLAQATPVPQYNWLAPFQPTFSF